MNRKTFERYGFETLHDLERFLGREDIKRIIGKNYDHYYDLWTARYKYLVMDEPKQKIRGSFNWLAFLLGFHNWAGYRRMYSYVFTIGILLGVLTFFEVYYDLKSTPLLGMWFVLALFSKDYYLSHLVLCAKKIDAMHSSYRIETFLKRHDGTSVFLAIMAFIISFFIVLMGAYFGAVFSGKELF